MKVRVRFDVRAKGKESVKDERAKVGPPRRRDVSD
jgi:hypothetical protein